MHRLRSLEGAGLGEIEAVYRREAGRFLRLARAVVGTDDEAWDAVQDAVASVVRARGSYNGTGSVEAWMWRAVLNAARSRRRRTGPVLVGDARVVESVAPVSEDGDAVRAGVAQLPERQRLVLFLRYYADLEYGAIAEVLGISPNTVGPALASAQANLRRLLEGAS